MPTGTTLKGILAEPDEAAQPKGSVLAGILSQPKASQPAGKPKGRARRAPRISPAREAHILAADNAELNHKPGPDYAGDFARADLGPINRISEAPDKRIGANLLLSLPQAAREVVQGLGSFGGDLVGYGVKAAGAALHSPETEHVGSEIQHAIPGYKPTTEGGRFLGALVEEATGAAVLSGVGADLRDLVNAKLPGHPLLAEGADLAPSVAAIGLGALHGVGGDETVEVGGKAVKLPDFSKANAAVARAARELTRRQRAAYVARQGAQHFDTAEKTSAELRAQHLAEGPRVAESAVTERRHVENSALRQRINELQKQGREAEADRLASEDQGTGALSGKELAARIAQNDGRPLEPYVALVDADGLKYVNDLTPDHHTAGTELLRHIVDAFTGAGAAVYREHQGDEFVLFGRTPDELAAQIHTAREALDQGPRTMGIVPRFSAGIARSGETLDSLTKAADQGLAKDKAAREAAGVRAPRGMAPPGFVPPEIADDLDEAASLPDDLDAALPPEPKGAPSTEPVDEFGFTPSQYARVLHQPGLGERWARFWDEVKRLKHRVIASPRNLREEQVLADRNAAVGQTRYEYLRSLYQKRTLTRALDHLTREQQLKVLMAAEEGRYPDGPLGTLVRAAHEHFEKLFEDEAREDIDPYDPVENYVYHLVKIPADERARIEAQLSASDKVRPGFTRDRFFRTYADIVRAANETGSHITIAEPNLGRIWDARDNAHARAVNATRAMRLIVDDGGVRRARMGETPTPGEEKFTIAGREYIGPEGVPDILRNTLLKTDILDSHTVLGSVLRAGHALKQITTTSVLGLSLYHPMHLGIYVKVVSPLAEAGMRILSRPPSVESFEDFRRSLRDTFTGRADRGLVEGKTYTGRRALALIEGKIKPEDWTERDKEVQRRIAAANISIAPNPMVANVELARMHAAIRNGNYAGASLWAIPALFRVTSYPIMDYFVPIMKARAFLGETDRWIADHPQAGPETPEYRLAMNRIGDTVDERIGELSVNRKAWDPILTGAAQSMLLSFGWNYGFVKQFGGGLYDLATIPLEKLGVKKARPWIQSRALYAMLYTGWGALLGGLFTRYVGGVTPTSIKDFFYPVLYVDANGKKHRVTAPSFMRDFGGLYYSWDDAGVHGVAQMASYKLAPLWAILREQWTNENFYNQQVSDPTAPFYTQLAERAEAAFEQETPISVQSALEASTEPTGRRIESDTLSFLGINAAPGYASNSMFVNRTLAAFGEYDQGITPFGKVKGAEAMRQVRALWLAGQHTAARKLEQQSAREYGWTRTQREDLSKSVLEPPYAFEFSRIPPALQWQFFTEAPVETEKAYGPFLTPKLREKGYEFMKNRAEALQHKAKAAPLELSGQ